MPYYIETDKYLGEVDGVLRYGNIYTHWLIPSSKDIQEMTPDRLMQWMNSKPINEYQFCYQRKPVASFGEVLNFWVEP